MMAQKAEKQESVLTDKEEQELVGHITRGVSALQAQGPVCTARERFAVEPQDLICGEFEQAAKGVQAVEREREGSVWALASWRQGY